jgi:PAS domain S-box-containing protein
MKWTATTRASHRSRAPADSVVVGRAPDGEILFSNRHAEQVVGRRLADIAGDFPMFHPASGRPFALEQRQLPRALQGEEIEGEEFLGPKRAGAQALYRVSCWPVRDGSEIVAAVAVTRDVTAEKLEQQERDLLAGVIQSSSDFIGISSLAGRPHFLNRAGRLTVGFGHRNLADTHIADFVAPADRARVRDVLLPELLELGRWPEATSVGLRHWDTGATIPVIWDAFRIDDPETDEPIALATITRDISERSAAEEERDLRARQEALVGDLSVRALERGDLQPLLDDGVVLAARALGLDLAFVAELLAGDGDLAWRASCGWSEEAERQLAGTRLARGSMPGYVVQSGGPVIADDAATDERFTISRQFASGAPIAAVGVVIPGVDRPFGALVAAATQSRSFSAGDVVFLQSVANVLGAAAARASADGRGVELLEWERRQIARELRTIEELAAASGPQTSARLDAAVFELTLGDRQDQPFAALLSGLVAAHDAAAVDVRVELDVDGALPALLGRRGGEAVRVVGEAVTNARRHAGASVIRVVARASATSLTVEVIDDGSGIEAGGGERRDASALTMMRERSARIGAALTVHADRGHGTTTTLTLPLTEHGTEAAPAPIRVLLVDAQTAARQAIAARFELDPGFAVIGQAGTVAAARALLQDVDVAVIDLALPDGSGLGLIRELAAVNPRAQTLVLSARLDRVQMALAIESGAGATLEKTAQLGEVLDRVRRLHAGETLVPLEEVVQLLRLASERRAQEVIDRAALESLTPRERDVLQALAEGLDSQAVADRLHIALQTERNHVANILAKLGVHSQLQALVFVLRYDIVKVR